jgi:hypothetical protein
MTPMTCVAELAVPCLLKFASSVWESVLNTVRSYIPDD